MHGKGRSNEVIVEPGASWQECEDELDARGTPLPLFHRAIWARAHSTSGDRCTFVPVRNSDGICRAGFAFESQRSRALPGHRLISIHRFGIGSGGLDDSSLDSALAVLCTYVRRDRSVLRVTAEAFAIDEDSRIRTSEALRRHGFRQVPASRMYERTLVVDLAPQEDDLLAAFHKNARQGIRNIDRYPVILTSAESVALAPRLKQLSDETRERTGGAKRLLDWKSLISMSAAVPHLSRIAILRRTDMTEPEGVLAFVWGRMHGGIAEYAESGSTRADDLKVSTSYALLWDLMRWARASGARWFDMGGITGGTTHSEDPLGGISDFKRRFSRQEIEVGQQWELEPHPLRAAAARFVSRSADALRFGTKRPDR